MTTNLLSVIEQQQAALKHAIKWLNICDKPRECMPLHDAIAAGKQALEQAQGEAVDIDALCARIKAADDACADMDYMLDSNDCISVLRGTWMGPMLNDCPPQVEPAPDMGNHITEPAPSTAGERDRTIVSLPIPSSASDLKSDIAELIQSHKYKGLRSIEVLGVFQFLGAEIISGSNS